MSCYSEKKISEREIKQQTAIFESVTNFLFRSYRILRFRARERWLSCCCCCPAVYVPDLLSPVTCPLPSSTAANLLFSLASHAALSRSPPSLICCSHSLSPSLFPSSESFQCDLSLPLRGLTHSWSGKRKPSSRHFMSDSWISRAATSESNATRFLDFSRRSLCNASLSSLYLSQPSWDSEAIDPRSERTFVEVVLQTLSRYISII